MLNDDIRPILYSTKIVGESLFDEDSLEFNVIRRVVKIKQKNEQVVTAYFKRTYNKNSNKPEAILLFDFPFLSWNDDMLKENGFEIKREGGDDMWTDELGDRTYAPKWTTIKKNGAEITL